MSEAAIWALPDGQWHLPEGGRRPLRTAATVGAALLTLGVVEKFGSRLLWREQDETNIHMLSSLPPAYDDERLPEGWLVVPGLGCKDGTEIARLTSYNTAPGKPMAYVRYANRGIEPGAIAAPLGEYANKLDRLSVMGHSMGTLIFLDSVSHLVRQGVRMPPIQTLVMNCSPYSIEDTHLRRAAKFVAASGYSGGVVSKLLFAGIRNMHLAGYDIRRFPDAVKDAGKQAVKGVAPSLWMRQLRFLADTDIESMREDLVGVITPDTRVLHCVPGDYRKDRTVNHTTSEVNWGKFFSPYGARFEVVRMPGTGHADITAAAKYAGERLLR